MESFFPIFFVAILIVLPTLTVPDVFLSVKVVFFLDTETTHFADFLSAVTVIVATPTFLPVTIPFETDAIFVLEDFHATLLIVAFFGLYVGCNATVSPTFTLASFKVTDLTFVAFFTTFTVTVALAFLLLFAVTVIVALPAFFFAVITPLLLTVAIPVLLDFHVNFLLVAFFGSTLAPTVIFLPNCR